jgi:hypothetical protein
MNLDLSPRETLQARMIAFAYENVRCGLLPDAGDLASVYIERLDKKVKTSPSDSPGYWANFYFSQWKCDLEDLELGVKLAPAWEEEDTAKEAAQDRWLWHEANDTLDLY